MTKTDDLMADMVEDCASIVGPLADALRAFIKATEERPSPNGICDWTKAQHEAAAHAWAVLAELEVK